MTHHPKERRGSAKGHYACLSKRDVSVSVGVVGEGSIIRRRGRIKHAKVLVERQTHKRLRRKEVNYDASTLLAFEVADLDRPFDRGFGVRERLVRFHAVVSRFQSVSVPDFEMSGVVGDGLLGGAHSARVAEDEEALDVQLSGLRAFLNLADEVLAFLGYGVEDGLALDG